MAKGKSGKFSRRRRGRNGLPGRKLVRQLALCPLKAQPPADPPSRPLIYENSAVIRLFILPNTGSGQVIEFSDKRNPTVTLPSTFKLTLTKRDCVDLITNWAYLEKANLPLEFTLQKVSVWGPASISDDIKPPVLVVDLGAHTACYAVSDRPAANHRTRCGISVPFMFWMASSDEGIVSATFPISDVKSRGIMDISLRWRVNHSL